MASAGELGAKFLNGSAIASNHVNLVVFEGFGEILASGVADQLGGARELGAAVACLSFVLDHGLGIAAIGNADP